MHGRRVRNREDGASAVEYGLLIAAVAGLIAATVFLFGKTVLGLFDTTCSSINSAAAGHSSLTC